MLNKVDSVGRKIIAHNIKSQQQERAKWIDGDEINILIKLVQEIERNEADTHILVSYYSLADALDYLTPLKEMYYARLSHALDHIYYTLKDIHNAELIQELIGRDFYNTSDIDMIDNYKFITERRERFTKNVEHVQTSFRHLNAINTVIDELNNIYNIDGLDFYKTDLKPFKRTINMFNELVSSDRTDAIRGIVEHIDVEALLYVPVRKRGDVKRQINRHKETSERYELMELFGYASHLVKTSELSRKYIL